MPTLWEELEALRKRREEPDVTLSSFEVLQKKYEQMREKYGEGNVQVLKFTTGEPYKLVGLDPEKGDIQKDFRVEEIVVEDFLEKHQKAVAESAQRKVSPLTAKERGLAGLNVKEEDKIKSLRETLGAENVEPIIEKGQLKEILVRREKGQKWSAADPGSTFQEIMGAAGVATGVLGLGMLGPAAPLAGLGMIKAAGVEPREAAADVAELAGPAIEFGPGTAGAVAGATIPIPYVGPAAGAAIGGALGDIVGAPLRAAAAKLFSPGEKSLTAKELGTRIAANAASGVISEGAARVLGSVVRGLKGEISPAKLGRRIAEQPVTLGRETLPTSEVARRTMAEAERFGVRDLPPSGLARGLSGEAAEFDRLIAGALPDEFQQAYIRRSKVFARNVDRFVDKVFGGRVSKENLGKKFIDVYDNYVKNEIKTIKKAGDVAFDAARVRGQGQLVASGQNAARALDELIKEVSDPASLNRAALPHLKRFRRVIKKQKGFLTIDQLDRRLQEWGASTGSGRLAWERVSLPFREKAARRVFGALQQDLQATSRLGYPELEDARRTYAAMNEDFRQSRLAVIEDVLSKALKPKAPKPGQPRFTLGDVERPEIIVEELMKKPVADQRRALDLIEGLSPTVGREYRRELVQQVLEKSKPKVRVLKAARIRRDPGKLGAVLADEKQEEILKGVLPRKGYRFLQRVKLVGDAIDQGRIAIKGKKVMGRGLLMRALGGIHMIRGRKGTGFLFVINPSQGIEIARQLASSPSAQAAIVADPQKLRVFMGIDKPARRFNRAAFMRLLADVGLDVSRIENLQEVPE